MIETRSYNRGLCWSARLAVCVILLLSAFPAYCAEKVVGVIMTADLPRYREAHKYFVKAMARHGYDNSRIEIIMQTPNPDPISWANSARKLEALGSDVIVAYGAPATLAVLREVSNTPVVFSDVYDPIETGISRSMSSSGRNYCGISAKVPIITLIKAVQDIREIKNVGVLYSSKEAGSVAQLKEMKRAAAQLGLSVQDANVTSARQLDTALTSLLESVDCVYVSESAVVSRGFERIVQKAAAHKVPVISQVPDAAEKGAVVSLEISQAEQGAVAGEYAADILKGRKPASFSIASPKKVDLVVNMKAAKALGMNVPFQVLSAATKVIK